MEDKKEENEQPNPNEKINHIAITESAGKSRRISRHRSHNAENWLEATLHEKGDNVDLTEIGLQIIHEGGGHKAIRRCTVGNKDELRTKNVDFVFLSVTFIENNKLTNKYQFYSGDRSPVELVLDTNNWLAPINRTYLVRVLKIGKDGQDVRFKVKKVTPPKATVEVIVRQISEGEE